MKRARPQPASSRRLRREEHRLAHPAFVDGCRRCRSREAMATFDFSTRRRPAVPRPDAWDSEEDARLAALCGHFTPTEIAVHLNEEFHRADGITRTDQAVIVRMKLRGLSRWMHGYRMHEVEQIFRFDHRAMHVRWLQTGLLVPTRTFNGRGTARQNYVFTDEDLLRFVREYPWAYDYRRFRDPAELPRHLQGIARRLRAEAETAWRSDPYLTRGEFLTEMGWKGPGSKCPWWYWATGPRHRLVPYRLRYHVFPATSGCRNTGQPLVRVRDLPAIREAIAAAKAEGKATRVAKRVGRPAHNRGKPTPVRRLKVLRCYTCHEIIVRRNWLPLRHGDCGGLAWRPEDVPRLTIFQGHNGACFVSRWPVESEDAA